MLSECINIEVWNYIVSLPVSPVGYSKEDLLDTVSYRENSDEVMELIVEVLHKGWAHCCDSFDISVVKEVQSKMPSMTWDKEYIARLHDMIYA